MFTHFLGINLLLKVYCLTKKFTFGSEPDRLEIFRQRPKILKRNCHSFVEFSQNPESVIVTKMAFQSLRFSFSNYTFLRSAHSSSIFLFPCRSASSSSGNFNCYFFCAHQVFWHVWNIILTQYSPGFRKYIAEMNENWIFLVITIWFSEIYKRIEQNLNFYSYNYVGSEM